METIHLTDVLALMDSVDSSGYPLPFKITFCTYSETTGKGGERITMENSIKVIGKSNGKVVVDSRESNNSVSPKNPNHIKNKTRNIMSLQSKEIRKVRIRLIEFFNDKKVIW